MENAIRTILDAIPREMIFDSHYVISQLIKYHSDVYLNFASGINASSNKTEIVHMAIGRKIAKHEPDVLSKIDSISWSENIHGNSSRCAAWKKP